MTLRAATVLRFMLPIGILAGGPTRVDAQTSFMRLAPDLYFYDTGGAANSTVLITNEGVLIVDSQGTEREATALLGEIRKLSAAPIRWVVNGQDHGDHYFGNAVFKREGATIVAETETARTIERNYEYELEWRRLTRAAAAHVPPDVTFSHQMTIRLGGRDVILVHVGAGQNPGDTVVLFPHARAAYPSGAFAPKSWSSTAYASSLDSWIAVLDRLRALDVDVYLPGHGQLVRDRAEIDEEIVFLRELGAGVRTAIAKGLTADEAARTLTFDRYASWRGSDRRERNIRNAHYLLTTGRPIYFDYLDRRTSLKPY
jgi:cyclase